VVVVMMTIMGKMEKRDDLSFRNRALYRSAWEPHFSVGGVYNYGDNEDPV
jgi:hypothetical protein